MSDWLIDWLLFACIYILGLYDSIITLNNTIYVHNKLHTFYNGWMNGNENENEGDWMNEWIVNNNCWIMSVNNNNNNCKYIN